MSIFKAVLRIGALFAVAAASGAAQAAVVEAGAYGFAIEQTVHIKASPDKVYSALVRPAKWWNPEHTFSQSSANLSLDARAGGCLCEKLPHGGSVQHLVVVVADPGHTLRLRGAMGPMQGQGVDGALTFTLTPKEGGTDLKLENSVGGFARGGLAQLPRAVDAMLADLLAHFKNYCDGIKN
jgi:uncharacterized protein YndB with AHSA1/START domain